MGKSTNSDASDGFSTLEMLVAFVVLSLGLGLAIQSISQAGLSLRQASETREELALLHQVMAEELPALLAGSRDVRRTASGKGWRLDIAPLEPGRERSALRVTAHVSARQGARETAYVTVVAPPPAAGTQAALPLAARSAM